MESVGKFTLTPQLVKEVNDAVLNRYKMGVLLDRCHVEELKLLNDYLWSELIKKGPQLFGKAVDHQFIISKLEPLDAFQIKNKCPEPAAKCFQNVCVKTSPRCSTIKLKSNINILASLFERRKSRNIDKNKSLFSYLKFFVERHNLVEAALLDFKNRIIAKYSESEPSGIKPSIMMTVAFFKLDPFSADLEGKSVETLYYQQIIASDLKLVYGKMQNNALSVDIEKAKNDNLRIWNDTKLVSTFGR